MCGEDPGKTASPKMGKGRAALNGRTGGDKDSIATECISESLKELDISNLD